MKMLEISKRIKKEKKPFKFLLGQNGYEEVIDLAKTKKNQKIIKAKDFLKNFIDSEKKLLDVSASKNDNFEGFLGESELITMSLRQFYDYKGEFNLYLAQHPLYRSLLAKNDVQKNLRTSKTKKLLQELNRKNYQSLLEKGFKLPFCLEKCIKNLYSINIWYSKKATKTNWHYDSHDNFMILLEGSKTFYFLPQNNQSLVKGEMLGPNYNQAQEGSGIKNDPQLIKITLKQNECLYIPQGYYHKVDSEGSLAINIWFNSVYNLFKSKKEQFYCRYVLNEIYLNQKKQEKFTPDIQINPQIKKLIENEEFISLTQLIINSNELQNQAFLFMNESQTIRFFQQLIQFEPQKLQNLISNTQNQNLLIISQKFENSDLQLDQFELEESINKSYLEVLENKNIEKQKFYNSLWSVIDHQDFFDKVMQAQKQMNQCIL